MPRQKDRCTRGPADPYNITGLHRVNTKNGRSQKGGVCVRRKRPKPHRQCRTVWGIRILVLAVLLGYLIFSADQCLARGVQEYAAFECERIAAGAVQSAVSETLHQDPAWADTLYSINRDANGRVTQVIVNTARMNEAQTKTAAALGRALDLAVREQPQVHITALLGTYFFSQEGPMIRMKIYPQHFSRVQIRPGLQSAGVNQTRFSMELTFEIALSTSLLNYRSRAESNITVPLADVLIVGNVPAYYAN